MSANTSVGTPTLSSRVKDRAHRLRLIFAYSVAIALIGGLLVYGFDYYTLSSIDRPFSPKHHLLRPSGRIGLNLGFLGIAMFFSIFLYPLRKHWLWLARQGNSRHWLDIHVSLGLSAPFIIALHSSFKFHGFAGIAFWIMLAVSISGVIGRYLYGQIPRRVNAAEISRKELQDMHENLAQQLAGQRLLPEADLGVLLRLPSQERVESLPMMAALVYMMTLDVVRVFRVARLRRHPLSFSEQVSTLGGLLKTHHINLEIAIATAKEDAATAKRILFLSQAEKVFHLWHVVHKPFSYTFAMLALIHIGIVIAMGYF
jgi:hypothetical protein